MQIRTLTYRRQERYRDTKLLKGDNTSFRFASVYNIKYNSIKKYIQLDRRIGGFSIRGFIYPWLAVARNKFGKLKK